jgi:hypothetical protein
LGCWGWGFGGGASGPPPQPPNPQSPIPNPQSPENILFNYIKFFSIIIYYLKSKKEIGKKISYIYI